MKPGRAFLAGIAFFAVNFFVFWIASALLPPGRAAPFVAALLALLAAIAAAWSIGRRPVTPPGWTRYVLQGALVTGSIGFLAGFFGPIVFTPDANQGPLLGIFVTGPLGFLLGGIGGAFSWALRDPGEERP